MHYTFIIKIIKIYIRINIILNNIITKLLMEGKFENDKIIDHGSS